MRITIAFALMYFHTCLGEWWKDQHSVSVEMDELGRYNLIYAVAGSQLYINTSINEMLPTLGVSPCNVLFIDARGDTGRQIDEFARSSKWHSSRHLAVVLNAEEVEETELRRLNFLLHFPDADVSGFANTVAVLAWNTLEDKGAPHIPHEDVASLKRYLAHRLNSDSANVNGMALVGRIRRFSLESADDRTVNMSESFISDSFSCSNDALGIPNRSRFRVLPFASLHAIFGRFFSGEIYNFLFIILLAYFAVLFI